jgi:hypothetical protein
MKVGQLVEVVFEGTKKVGLISRCEKDIISKEWWFEVMVDDGTHHIVPGWIVRPLSPAPRNNRGPEAAKLFAKKLKYFQQHSTKTSPTTLNYIHNKNTKSKITHKK